MAEPADDKKPKEKEVESVSLFQDGKKTQVITKYVGVEKEEIKSVVNDPNKPILIPANIKTVAVDGLNGTYVKLAKGAEVSFEGKFTTLSVSGEGKATVATKPFNGKGAKPASLFIGKDTQLVLDPEGDLEVYAKGKLNSGKESERLIMEFAPTKTNNYLRFIVGTQKSIGVQLAPGAKGSVSINGNELTVTNEPKLTAAAVKAAFIKSTGGKIEVLSLDEAKKLPKADQFRNNKTDPAIPSKKTSMSAPERDYAFAYKEAEGEHASHGLPPVSPPRGRGGNGFKLS